MAGRRCIRDHIQFMKFIRRAHTTDLVFKVIKIEETRLAIRRLACVVGMALCAPSIRLRNPWGTGNVSDGWSLVYVFINLELMRPSASGGEPTNGRTRSICHSFALFFYEFSSPTSAPFPFAINFTFPLQDTLYNTTCIRMSILQQRVRIYRMNEARFLMIYVLCQCHITCCTYIYVNESKAIKWTVML